MKYFCPACWEMLDEPAARCPNCGADFQNYDRRSYEQKLIAALRHPLPDRRMLAVQVLGQIRSRRALPEFRRLLETESDYYLLKEVLLALATIRTPGALSLLRDEQRHPVKLVRDLARTLVARPQPRRQRNRA